MDIKIWPVGKKKEMFVFPALPESVSGSYSTSYQSFDIISGGEVKVPKGMETGKISWSGEFFGKSKKKESIVKKKHWTAPKECIKLLRQWQRSGEVLQLVVTGTWINQKVTIDSFEVEAYGAYGNVRYSISFSQYKELKIYLLSEKKDITAGESASKKKKTKERSNASKHKKIDSSGAYVVKAEDSLWSIASSLCGGGSNWTKIYAANKDSIEAEAKRRGLSNSDKGRYIFPGTTLKID